MINSKTFGPLSKEHCRQVIEYYLNTSKRRLKHHEFSYEDYYRMKEDKNLTHIITRLEKKDLIQTKINFENPEGERLDIPNDKSRVILFDVDYRLLDSQGGVKKRKLNKKIVAKTYPASSKQYTQRELNAIKLCSDAFKNSSSEHAKFHKKLIPKCFTYDSENSVFFREFVKGVSLTDVVYNVYGSLLKERKIKQREIMANNLKNLIKYSVETLATFHETVSNYEKSILKREFGSTKGYDPILRVKRPDPYDYAVNFADHSIELSHQIDKRRRININRQHYRSDIDYLWQDQIINEFLKSKLGKLFDSQEGKDFGVLMGDCYPDNFLIQIEKLFPQFVKYGLNFSNYTELFKRNINPELEGRRFKESIKMFDFGKCEINYFQKDLNDLLNQVYEGFRVQPRDLYTESPSEKLSLKKFREKISKMDVKDEKANLYDTDDFIRNNIRNYIGYINSMRRYKEKKIHYKNFRTKYNFCAIPELMRYAANEKVGLFKREYIKRLDNVMNQYGEFDDLRRVLDKRNLFNLDKYEGVNLVRRKSS